MIPGVPTFPPGTSIPKVIHQTYSVRQLPPQLAATVDELVRMNRTWERRFYNDADIEAYIDRHYGQETLASFRSIEPRYGAPRADLFRYLLVYREGGVYLDIKSGVSRPLDAMLLPDDRFVICTWDNGPGRPFKNFGIHPALRGIPGGEYQQWHVIAAAGSPLLRAVIETVLDNIHAYRPWRNGGGRMAVLETTGPIAYTLAIHPLLTRVPHRNAGSHGDLGLVYVATAVPHRRLCSHDYSIQSRPPIRQSRLSGAAAKLFCRMLDGRDAVRHAVWNVRDRIVPRPRG
jgi:hypothetical protein